MFFMRSMKRNLIWTLSRIQSKKSTGPFTAQLLRDKRELNTCFLKAALCGRLPSSRVQQGNLLYRVQVAPGPMAALTEDAHSRRGWALCENSLLLYYTHQHAHLKSLTYSKKKTSLMRNLNTCMKKNTLHLESFKFGLNCIFISVWLPTPFVCSQNLCIF